MSSPVKLTGMFSDVVSGERDGVVFGVVLVVVFGVVSCFVWVVFVSVSPPFCGRTSCTVWNVAASPEISFLVSSVGRSPMFVV